MENNKHKFVVPTPEEEKAFNEDLVALAKKHSFMLELVPQFKPNQETKAYEITCMLLLQKIVEIPEVVQEGAVASTNPEVNPAA